MLKIMKIICILVCPLVYIFVQLAKKFNKTMEETKQLQRNEMVVRMSRLQ